MGKKPIKIVIENVDKKTCETIGGEWKNGSCELDLNLDSIKIKFGTAYFVLKKKK